MKNREKINKWQIIALFAIFLLLVFGESLVELLIK